MLSKYSYDGLGRRVSSAQYETNTQHAILKSSTSYNGLGFELLEENISGMVNDQYTHSYANGRMIARAGSTDTSYYTHDRLGSVTAVTDPNGHLGIQTGSLKKNLIY